MSNQGTIPFKEKKPADIHRSHSHVAHSGNCISGTMTCTSCGQKITKGEYLIVEHYCSKRGNEDDYAELFHKECSADNNTWKKHEKEIQDSKDQALNSRLIREQPLSPSRISSMSMARQSWRYIKTTIQPLLLYTVNIKKP